MEASSVKCLKLTPLSIYLLDVKVVDNNKDILLLHQVALINKEPYTKNKGASDGKFNFCHLVSFGMNEAYFNHTNNKFTKLKFA